MKTPEDEAFEEIERRQGGGFPAKRAMAKARIEEDDDIQVYKRPWIGLTDEERDMFIYIDEKDKRRFRKYGKYIEQLLKEKNA